MFIWLIKKKLDLSIGFLLTSILHFNQLSFSDLVQSNKPIHRIFLNIPLDFPQNTVKVLAICNILIIYHLISSAYLSSPRKHQSTYDSRSSLYVPNSQKSRTIGDTSTSPAAVSFRRLRNFHRAGRAVSTLRTKTVERVRASAGHLTRLFLSLLSQCCAGEES